MVVRHTICNEYIGDIMGKPCVARSINDRYINVVKLTGSMILHTHVEWLETQFEDLASIRASSSGAQEFDPDYVRVMASLVVAARSRQMRLFEGCVEEIAVTMPGLCDRIAEMEEEQGTA